MSFQRQSHSTPRCLTTLAKHDLTLTLTLALICKVVEAGIKEETNFVHRDLESIHQALIALSDDYEETKKEVKQNTASLAFLTEEVCHEPQPQNPNF